MLILFIFLRVLFPGVNVFKIIVGRFRRSAVVAVIVQLSTLILIIIYTVMYTVNVALEMSTLSKAHTL